MGATSPTPLTRSCVACHRDLPVERFASSGHGNGRRHTCRQCIGDAQRRTRRARKAPIRHPRYNGRGQVWCNSCQRYLDSDDFKRHPSRPHTFWSYCRVCTREIDRARYARRNADLDRAIAEADRRLARKRKQSRQEQRERKNFVRESIVLLRRRGLTKAEICLLTDTSFGSLLNWERGTVRVTPAVAKRFGIVVRESGDLPVGDELAYRSHHPAMGELMARCLDQVQAINVRNSWKNGNRA